MTQERDNHTIQSTTGLIDIEDPGVVLFQGRVSEAMNRQGKRVDNSKRRHSQKPRKTYDERVYSSRRHRLLMLNTHQAIVTGLESNGLVLRAGTILDEPQVVERNPRRQPALFGEEIAEHDSRLSTRPVEPEYTPLSPYQFAATRPEPEEQYRALLPRDCDPDIIDILVEEQSRGQIGGREPTQIQNLTYIDPRKNMSPAQDSFDHQSRP